MPISTPTLNPHPFPSNWGRKRIYVFACSVDDFMLLFARWQSTTWRGDATAVRRSHSTCYYYYYVIPEPPATLQGAATGRIQWHVIPEPRITLHWRIYWHDSTATCYILQGVRIPSAILKIVFRHILFIFCFLMQFGL